MEQHIRIFLDSLAADIVRDYSERSVNGGGISLVGKDGEERRYLHACVRKKLVDKKFGSTHIEVRHDNDWSQAHCVRLDEFLKLHGKVKKTKGAT